MSRGNRPKRLRRAQILIPLAAALAAQFGWLATSTPAAADQITSEKAQASQIAAKITLLNNQVNVLDEQYNQATLKLDGIQSQIRHTTAAISHQQAKVDAMKAKLASEAITQYTQAGTATGLITLLQGTVTDASVKQVMVNTVSFSQQDLVSAYQSAKSALEADQTQFSQEQAQAKATVNQLATARASAQSATSQEQLQLSSLNGNIAILVQQQQQQQARAAAARAQAALLQQQIQQRQQQGQAQPNGQNQAQPNGQNQAQPNGQNQAQGLSQSNSTPAILQPNVSVPASNVAAVALSWARQQLGKPYVFGAAGPGAFDCSGLMAYIFAKAGVYLPHSAAAQYDVTQRVSYSNLQPGDLVFYYQPIDHVGIYIGGGNIIVADNPSVPVKVDSLYWDGVPVGFGRVG